MGYLSNKCKVCGYRFKKNDGVICPECFTSREETLDCNDLSGDVHSHSIGFDMDSFFTKKSEDDFDVNKELEKEKLDNAKFQAEFSKRKKDFNEKVQKATGSKGYRTTYTHQRSSSSSSSDNKGLGSFQRLTEQQRKKLEAYYNSRNVSQPTISPSSNSGAFLGNKHFFEKEIKKINSSKKKINIIVIIVIIIIALNVLFSALGGISGLVLSGINDDDYSFYSNDYVDFNTTITYNDVKYALDEPVIISDSIETVFPDFTQCISGISNYDGEYSIVQVNLYATNIGDYNAYFNLDSIIKLCYDGTDAQGYDFSITSHILGYYFEDKFYRYSDEMQENFIALGQSHEYIIYFAIPYCDDMSDNSYMYNGMYYVEATAESSDGIYDTYEIEFDPDEIYTVNNDEVSEENESDENFSDENSDINV